MKEMEIQLEELLLKGKTDSISGRDIGEDYAIKYDIVNKLEDHNFKIIISEKIKAINDSFIKGFFSKIFEQLKSEKRVNEKFQVIGDQYFVNLFSKNFRILDSIYNV